MVSEVEGGEGVEIEEDPALLLEDDTWLVDGTLILLLLEVAGGMLLGDVEEVEQIAVLLIIYKLRALLPPHADDVSPLHLVPQVD